MSKFIRAYAYLVVIAGLIIVFDYWTKWLVRTNLVIGEQWAPWPWLLPYARIVYWHNTGAAFGMFQNMNTFFSILAVVVSAIILYYFPQVPKTEWHLRLAMSLQMGGAIGNLIDRLREGFVIDFVSVGAFAVFNVADASISIGVAVLVLGVLVKDWQHRQAAAVFQTSLNGTETGVASNLPPEAAVQIAENEPPVSLGDNLPENGRQNPPGSANPASHLEQPARSAE